MSLRRTSDWVAVAPSDSMGSGSTIARVSMAFVVAFVGYAALVPAGLMAVAPGYRFSMIWPASAFAGIALYQTTGRARIAVLAGVVFATFVCKQLYGDASALGSIAFSVVGAVGPTIFALILERSVPSDEFTTRPDSLFAMMGAGLAASLVSGAIGAGALSALYDVGFMDRWLRWSLGEAVGFCAFAPLFVHMANFGREPITTTRLLEGGAYVVSLVALTVCVFSIGLFEPVYTFSAATWLSLPLLLLATGRGSRLHGAFGIFAVTVVGVAFLVSRSGVFAQGDAEMRGEVVLFQIFVLSAVACMSIVGVYERDRIRSVIERSEKNVLESVTDLVVSVAPADGRILFANRRARSLMSGLGDRTVRPAPRNGQSWLASPSLMEIVRDVAATRLHRRQTIRSASLGKWFEIDFYPSPEGVALYARDVTDAHEMREQLDLVAREMNHRIQNFFAIASSVVSASARGAGTPEEVVSRARGRIDALAAAYRASKEGGRAGIFDLADLARIVLDPHRDGDRIEIDGPSVRLDMSTSTPMGLVLHELATNAVKYGALRQGDGRLRLSWRVLEDRLELTWLETCPDEISPPTRNGFGSRMTTSATEQMAGTIEHEWKSTGLSVRISVPLPVEDAASEPTKELADA